MANMHLAAESLSPSARRNLRLALVVALAIYGINYLRDPQGGHLIDGINLAIHETGHIVFSPFGEFIGALGGTLFQLIVPAVFCGYFARRGDRLGASVCLWWIAINCWNIAVYVADARAMELPLVGGGEHDWAFLLAEMDLLRQDQSVARVWKALGFLIFVASLTMATFAALDRKAPSAVATEGNPDYGTP